jgi:hypothetical protein
MVLFRIGLGAGVDRVAYQPHGDSTVLDLAPESHFFIPAACLWGGAEIRVSEHFALTSRVFADFALAHVHYYVENSNGESVQELAPYSIRAGLSLGVAFLF